MTAHSGTYYQSDIDGIEQTDRVVCHEPPNDRMLLCRPRLEAVAVKRIDYEEQSYISDQ